MEMPARRSEGPGRDTMGGCRSCRRLRLMVFVLSVATLSMVVALASIFILSGSIMMPTKSKPLFLLLDLFIHAEWREAPGMEATPSESDSAADQPQSCYEEHLNLSLMLTEDPRCRLCPDGWLWWRSHCYYFSVGRQENRKWNESADFCRQHNSSLSIIRDAAEMNFLQSVMSRFPKFPFLWVGLTDRQQEGRWLWWDGAEVQHHLPVIVQWDTEDWDCADLRGGGRLFAAHCDDYGPWLCQRPS